MIYPSVAFLLYFFLTISLCSQILSFDQLALTIYNDGFGVIKDTRTISLDPSQSYISVTDVAASIQPQTLFFRVFSTNQSIKILEQNFENNLIGKQAILKKYLNKQVTVFPNIDPLRIVPVNGTLLGYSPSCMVQTATGVEIFDEINGMMLSDLPDGLLIKPSLVWKVKSPFSVLREVQSEIGYRSTGFKWKADYNIIMTDDEKSIDLIGWVTIDNFSGKKYENAKVKLIAGDVNTVRRPMRFRRLAMCKGGFGRSAAPSGPPLVTEKSFADYHMYTISNQVTLNESSIKQIQFIPRITQIPIRKYYSLAISTGKYNAQSYTPLNMLSFNNSKQNKVGLPLPKGDFKILKLDHEDNSLEFLTGGNLRKHTPKNELVKFVLGTGVSNVVMKLKVVRGEDKGVFDDEWKADKELTVWNYSEKEADVEVMLVSRFGDNLEVVVEREEGLEVKKVSSFKRKLLMRVEGNGKRVVKWSEKLETKY